MDTRISLVMLVVFLQIGVALSLQWGATHAHTLSITILILSMALLLNGLRFVVWGALHRKYDLSKTYPLIALFFPIIYTIALYQNEATLSWHKILGLIFVFIGVFALTREKST